MDLMRCAVSCPTFTVVVALADLTHRHAITLPAPRPNQQPVFCTGVQSSVGGPCDDEDRNFSPYSQLVVTSTVAQGNKLLYKAILKDSTNLNTSLDFEHYFSVQHDGDVLDISAFDCSYHGWVSGLLSLALTPTLTTTTTPTLPSPTRTCWT